MALGASNGDVMRMVVIEGIRLAGAGALCRGVAALASVRVLRASLYGVQPFDPVTLLAVCGILALVVLLACWIPARRAAATAPASALRL